MALSLLKIKNNSKYMHFVKSKSERDAVSARLAPSRNLCRPETCPLFFQVLLLKYRYLYANQNQSFEAKPKRPLWKISKPKQSNSESDSLP